MTPKPSARRLLAFLYGAPIGALGGLIGLGGAEFRLPILGAFLGDILVPHVPAGALKVGLGVILIGSAIRIFRARPHGQ